MKMLFKEDISLIKNYFSVVKLHKVYATILFSSSLFGHGTGLLETVFTANLIQAITEQNLDAAYLNIFLVLLISIISNLFWYINYWSFAKNSTYTYKTLRLILTNKVMTYQTNFSEKKSTSTILNAANEVTDVAVFIDDISELFIELLKTIFLVAVFLKANPWMGILTILLSLAYAKVLDFSNAKMVHYLRGQLKYKDKITEDLRQILNGIGEIKQFFIQDKVLAKTQHLVGKRNDYYLKKSNWRSFKEGIAPIIICAEKAILYTVFCILVIKGQMEVATLIILISYFEKMTASINRLMGYSKTIRERSVSIDRVKRVLNYNGIDKLNFGDIEKDDIDGFVRFKNVNFNYRDGFRGSISNINFTAKPNEITAIVGRSGSGKTTLVNLLMRKHQPLKGQITIDGIDIFQYSNKIYANNITTVDQTPFMFNASIRNNLGMVDQNIKHQIAACKRIGIHDAIMRLPNGYNTLLNEGGKNFSSSQIQFLAMARALLTKAEIIVLDEATSIIDPTFSNEVKAILEDIRQTNTLIVVTHDKEMMQLADKVIVMDQGKIVGIGTHKELIKTNRYYQSIHNTSIDPDDIEDENSGD